MSEPIFSTRGKRFAAGALHLIRPAMAACLAGLMLAGCGGGGGSGSAATPSTAPQTTPAPAATGDGAAPAAVPIVAKPATGDCGPAGMPVSPSAHSTRDCAP